MKIGISKGDLPAIARSFCTLICGAGVGMFLAVGFVPKDDRGIFHFSYFVTALALAFGGSVLRSIIDSVRQKDVDQTTVHEKHVA